MNRYGKPLLSFQLRSGGDEMKQVQAIHELPLQNAELKTDVIGGGGGLTSGCLLCGRYFKNDHGVSIHVAKVHNNKPKAQGPVANIQEGNSAA